MTHRRFYRIAGITIQVDSDLPLNDSTFHPKFKKFETDGPGDDAIIIKHHFYIPDSIRIGVENEVYRKIPWSIHKHGGFWVYKGIFPNADDGEVSRIAVFTEDYTRAEIYNWSDEALERDNYEALSFFSTDQIYLARILADRQGCFLHSCGVIFNGVGFLFAGHSDAGKSTIAAMLREKAEILCDDRIIIRRWKGGFRIHGTWSHGDVPEVSANSAPLKRIFFIEKASENLIVPMNDRRAVVRRLLSMLIKPHMTASWVKKILDLIEGVAVEIPCYTLYFEKSGRFVDLFEKMAGGEWDAHREKYDNGFGRSNEPAMVKEAAVR